MDGAGVACRIETEVEAGRRITMNWLDCKSAKPVEADGKTEEGLVSCCGKGGQGCTATGG